MIIVQSNSSRRIEIQELGPSSAAAELPGEKANAATPGFVSLFNGRDLFGWKTHESQPSGWRVDNGQLIGDGPARSHLYSDRGDYRANPARGSPRCLKLSIL